MRKWKLAYIIVASCMITGCASNVKAGVESLEEGNYTEAITYFEKQIQRDKQESEACRGLGIAYFELGEYQSSLEAFTLALEHDTKETATLYNFLAAASMKLESYEEALSYYEKAGSMEDCSKELKQEIAWNEIAIYQKIGEWELLKEKVASYTEAYPEDTRLKKTIEFLETR